MHQPEDCTRSSKRRITFAPHADKWEMHQSTFLKDEFWSTVRHQLTLMQFPKNVDSLYADSSLTLRTKDLKTSVKITSCGEVQVERKLSKIECKCMSYKHSSIKESVAHFTEAVQKHLRIVLASDLASNPA